jgi:DNA polymerase III gamma/tau subunit
LKHFRNLVVLQALGPESKSLEATPEQIGTLVEQAKGIDAGRVFRICDQLSEMEDKLRHVLSVRTLIEMTLIRASRIATTATIEELMKAVRSLKSSGVADLPEIRIQSERLAAPAGASSAPAIVREPASDPVAPPPVQGNRRQRRVLAGDARQKELAA